eukprot:70172_1
MVDLVMKGWFSEVNSQWPGQAMSLEIDSVLFKERSKYQDVLVFKSKTFGNVLVLDGVIQLTERDECAYHEMMTHIAMFSHEAPQKILVIGGGDGGIVREILRHKSVSEVVVCEIDDVVIDCGKKFFPTVATGWDDPRVQVYSGDAVEYVKRDDCRGKFDVIICDSSDPVGPAEKLFEDQFYRDAHACLRDGGILCTQGESMWLHTDLIEKLVKGARKIFETAEYATTQIPTYPCGQIGFLLARKRQSASHSQKSTPCREPVRECVFQDDLRYYSSNLHRAAFVLPMFVRRRLEIEESKCDSI